MLLTLILWWEQVQKLAPWAWCKVKCHNCILVRVFYRIGNVSCRTIHHTLHHCSAPTSEDNAARRFTLHAPRTGAGLVHLRPHAGSRLCSHNGIAIGASVENHLRNVAVGPNLVVRHRKLLPCSRHGVAHHDKAGRRAPHAQQSAVARFDEGKRSRIRKERERRKLPPSMNTRIESREATVYVDWE